jgi:hypothetical protein
MNFRKQKPVRAPAADNPLAQSAPDPTRNVLRYLRVYLGSLFWTREKRNIKSRDQRSDLVSRVLRTPLHSRLRK